MEKFKNHVALRNAIHHSKNLNRKHKLLGVLLPFTFMLNNCKTPSQQYILNSQISWEQVMATAQQYGVQDLITQSNNSGLVLMAPEDLHAYMLEVKRGMEANKEIEMYFEKNKDVKTFDDYCKLVDALPNFKKAQVSAAGGEEKYRQWVEANRKIQWHIYRDQRGMLIWVRPEEEGNK